MFHTQLREQFPQPLHHKRGAQFAAGNIRHRIAHRQARRGLGKRGVEVLQFNAHPFHAGGGQLDAPEGQRLTVILVQQAAALTGVRQHVVIGSQQKEVACGMPVIPGNLTDGHLIQRHGDGTHAVLGQHQSEQPLKLALFQVFFP